MKVVGNVTAAPKGDKPTLNKQIKHNENGEWGVVGDNQIGDTVEFRTITKVPNTSGYTKYDYIIHDTMSAGLTSNVKTSADITIKVNDATVLPAEYYTVTANGNSFSVQVDILKVIQYGKLAHDNELYTYYTILLVLAFFAGLSLLLYPTVSDYWNSLHASQAVADYAENVRNLEAEKYEQVL